MDKTVEIPARPAGSGSAARPLVPSLVKAFAILDVVSRQAGITFTEIRARLGLPKSSAHQLIGALRDLGALQDGPDGGYVLGLGLCALGALATSQRPIERISLPFLKDLARDLELTCHLGVLEGHEAVYLARAEWVRDIRINTWVGKRLSLYCSSLGKVLLAWQPPARLEDLLASIAWVRRTPNTLPDAAALRRQLVQVRTCGWAYDDEEDMQNIRCVAAPVFDPQGSIAAAVSAVGTVLQMTPDDFPRLAGRVRAAADGISHALGRPA